MLVKPFDLRRLWGCQRPLAAQHPQEASGSPTPTRGLWQPNTHKVRAPFPFVSAVLLRTSQGTDGQQPLPDALGFTHISPAQYARLQHALAALGDAAAAAAAAVDRATAGGVTQQQQPKTATADATAAALHSSLPSSSGGGSGSSSSSSTLEAERQRLQLPAQVVAAAARMSGAYKAVRPVWVWLHWLACVGCGCAGSLEWAVAALARLQSLWLCWLACIRCSCTSLYGLWLRWLACIGCSCAGSLLWAVAALQASVAVVDAEGVGDYWCIGCGAWLMGRGVGRGGNVSAVVGLHMGRCVRAWEMPTGHLCLQDASACTFFHMGIMQGNSHP